MAVPANPPAQIDFMKKSNPTATGQVTARHARSIPLIVSFSGIDGAGKSTQIADLIARFREAGVSVRLIEFWDEIAAFRRLREAMGRAFFRGETGRGAP